ncbi:MAG: peptide-methionine (S)-S-oxide reductase MsrA [Bacteroidetes bacterium]|nr:peptide-methionine (S)-S-oxide reductase MsrA [Bacteroidota bacterium]
MSIFTTGMMSLGFLLACQGNPTKQTNKIDFQSEGNMKEIKDSNEVDTATFGAGCFWCVEAVFQDLKGVESVQSGYSGGKIANPTYREVCSGLTGHAEVVQIIYKPAVISYDELLEVFWQTHDPTTLNRQGADVGTQYRSVIFYHNTYQKERAEYYKKKLNEESAFPSPVVTEISPLEAFYPAEDYHQEYYTNNGQQPYCQMVIKPKVEKMKKIFGDKLKPGVK